jgi:hypothetical protein
MCGCQCCRPKEKRGEGDTNEGADRVIATGMDSLNLGCVGPPMLMWAAYNFTLISVTHGPPRGESAPPTQVAIRDPAPFPPRGQMSPSPLGSVRVAMGLRPRRGFCLPETHDVLYKNHRI